MKTALSPLLALLLCLLPSACSSPATDEARSSWSLAPARGLTDETVLTKGMPTMEVLKLLGAPKQKRVASDSPEHKETWTYFRVIQSGRSMTSSQVNGGMVTAYQPVFYDETLVLTFVADALASVQSRRIRQYGDENNSPVPR